MTTVAILVGATLCFGAVHDALTATQATDLNPQVTLGPLRNMVAEPAKLEAALLAASRAHIAALETMGPLRAAILFAFAIAAGFLVAIALRVRFSGAPPTAAVAFRMTIATSAAAILRTLAGAQSLVLARREADAYGEALITAGAKDAAPQAMLIHHVATFGSIAWTMLMVAVLLSIGAYFRAVVPERRVT